jgi:PAS domain S-box-containing protein
MRARNGRGSWFVPATVAVSGIAATVAVFGLSRKAVGNDDRRLLEQEAAITASAINATVGQVAGSLESAGVVATVTNGDPAAFRRVAQSPQSAFYRSMVLLRRAGRGWTPVVTTQPTVVDLNAPPNAVRRALDDPAPGNLVVTGLTGRGASRVLGLASRAAADPNWLVYAEVPLPEPTAGEANADEADSGFSKLDFALYLDTTERPSSLVLTNSTTLPITGRRAAVVFTLGATQPEAPLVGSAAARGALPDAPGRFLMVMSPRGHLTGGLAGALPWILLAAGVTATLAATAVIASARRRRDAALQLVADLEVAEAALREGEERFRRIVSETPDAILMTDVHAGGVSVVNRDAILGHPAATIASRDTFATLVHEDDRHELDAFAAAVVGSPDDRVHEAECRLRTAAGDWEWMRVRSKVLVRGEDGTGAREVLTLLTSIAEEKEAEEERLRLEEQLRRAHRLEAVGQLAGGIAHDFNNLLAVILNYASFVADDIGDHPARADVEEIQRAARRAADLTRQLLVFSRRDIVVPATIDLGELVTALERLLARTLGEDIDVRVDVSGDVAAVRADPGEIEQVLMNLAVNARDAMEGRGGVLSIGVRDVVLGACDVADRPGVAPGRHVEIRVADTGCGMAPEVVARAFEPFFTTKGPGRGTGLGLATVYGTAARWGGAVSIYSEVGQGTVVRVLLPACDSAVDDDARLGDAAPALPPTTAVVTGNATVLVVEDEPGVRAAARRILERCGYRVVEACDGASASTMSLDGIDLVLTDVVMPGGMSGRDLAEHVHLARPGLPVLYMSGYDGNVVAHHGTLDPGISLVQKPFTDAVLVAAVRDALAVAA